MASTPSLATKQGGDSLRIDRFLCISFQDEYKKFSLEELRYIDYKHDLRFPGDELSRIAARSAASNPFSRGSNLAPTEFKTYSLEEDGFKGNKLDLPIRRAGSKPHAGPSSISTQNSQVSTTATFRSTALARNDPPKAADNNGDVQTRHGEDLFMATAPAGPRFCLPPASGVDEETRQRFLSPEILAFIRKHPGVTESLDQIAKFLKDLSGKDRAREEMDLAIVLRQNIENFMLAKREERNKQLSTEGEEDSAALMDAIRELLHSPSMDVRPEAVTVIDPATMKQGTMEQELGKATTMPLLRHSFGTDDFSSRRPPNIPTSSTIRRSRRSHEPGSETLDLLDRENAFGSRGSSASVVTSPAAKVPPSGPRAYRETSNSTSVNNELSRVAFLSKNSLAPRPSLAASARFGKDTTHSPADTSFGPDAAKICFKCNIPTIRFFGEAFCQVCRSSKRPSDYSPLAVISASDAKDTASSSSMFVARSTPYISPYNRPIIPIGLRSDFYRSPYGASQATTVPATTTDSLRPSKRTRDDEPMCDSPHPAKKAHMKGGRTVKKEPGQQ